MVDKNAEFIYKQMHINQEKKRAINLKNEELQLKQLETLILQEKDELKMQRKEDSKKFKREKENPIMRELNEWCRNTEIKVKIEDGF